MAKTKGWKPRCALRVGVIGNRNLSDAAKAAAGKAVREVWTKIFASVPAVLKEERHGVRMCDLFSKEIPRVAVLSSLAKGADQIGAAAALEVAPAEGLVVELEALLPFAEEFFPGPIEQPREEFTESDANELRRLVSRGTQVVRLDGDYGTEEAKQQAYIQTTDLLLQNSDIVIAIFDPDAPARKAGTVESIGKALEYNTPVICVSVRADGTRSVDLRPARKGNWQCGIRESVREQLTLPELLTAHDDEKVQHVLDRLRLVLNPDDVPWLCRSEPLCEIFSATWKSLRDLTELAMCPDWRSRPPIIKDKPAVDDSVVLEPYAALEKPASYLADAFMRTYRGAFVLTYSLAGLAVTAAVLMMLALILFDKEPPLLVTVILGAAKIAIIVGLLLLERAARKMRLHESAVDFRYLAELIRPMQWLSPAGVYPPAVDLPLHTTQDDLRRSWMAWLVRAAARSTPSVSERQADHPRIIHITPESDAAALEGAAEAWIAGQIRYHHGNAKRMETLVEGAERAAKAMLWVVLVAAAMALTFELAGIAHTIAYVLGAIAAILPAFIAALTGIAFQSEAKRLAKRSEAMFHALQDQKTHFEVAAQQRRARAISHAHVAQLLRNASALTLNEAADWKVLYQAHELRAG